jgi:Acetyltransferase (GNAT) domain
MRAVPYVTSMQPAWDRFIGQSKNGTFLFLRDYMDYHADRFQDASLLFVEGDELVAVMPASREDGVLTSHAGLTYGGIVSDMRMRTPTMLEVFRCLIEFLQQAAIHRMIYKRVPQIYHDLPADEDLYALHMAGATLLCRDLSSTVAIGRDVPYTKGRKWALNKARRGQLSVSRSDDFDAFMAIEERVLREKYALTPVHTAAEIRLLADRFPENIKLFVATAGERLLGGVIMYETRHVAHAQYIAATDEGKNTCALDCILDFLIRDCYAGVRYFDFGVSTEKTGRLNTDLLRNKESYGARAVVYDTYEVTVP